MLRRFAYVTDFVSRELILDTGNPVDKGEKNYEELQTEKVNSGKVQMIRNLSANVIRVLTGQNGVNGHRTGIISSPVAFRQSYFVMHIVLKLNMKNFF